MTPSDLLPSMQDFLQLLQDHRLEDVDLILRSVLDDAPITIPVMLLRVTYPVRNQLPNWPLLLKNTRHSLVKEKLNPDGVLTGLED